MTPYGFQRVYPEHRSGERQPAGTLVPDPETAPIVAELFSRYAAGGWSTKDLASDLNARGIPGPGRPRKGQAVPVWTSGQICRLLRNPSYKGSVRYNGKPQGRFCRAEPGSAFTVEEAHEPLVLPAVWDAVQRRLGDGRTYTRVRDGRSETVTARHSAQKPLIAGLVVCHVCGGPLAALPPREGRAGELRCQRRTTGEGCTAQSYRLEPATTALLAEIARLRGSPWSTDAEERLAGPDAGVAQGIAAQLTDLRARLDTATELLLSGTAPERASVERVRAKLSTRITELEAQLAGLQHDAQALPRLRTLHAKLRATEIGPLVQRLHAQGDAIALRDLLVELVASATLVERRPPTRSTWLKMAVTWQPDVQLLLDHGLLTLDPAPARTGPVPPR